MAFGIKRTELNQWKADVNAGKIAFLTHFWKDPRFPGCNTVTKAGCADIEKLADWGRQYGLEPQWMDLRGDFPHFDLFGERQRTILQAEGQLAQLEKLEQKKK